MLPEALHLPEVFRPSVSAEEQVQERELAEQEPDKEEPVQVHSEERAPLPEESAEEPVQVREPEQGQEQELRGQQV